MRRLSLFAGATVAVSSILLACGDNGSSGPGGTGGSGADGSIDGNGNGNGSGTGGDGTSGPSDPVREDVFAGNHAVGVITLSEFHATGDNPTPSASAVFYPNTAGGLAAGSSCVEEVAGCKVTRTATCDPACDIYAGEYCAFDELCQPTCIKYCNAGCSATTEECYFDASGVAACRPRENFDAGTIVVQGSPQNLTLLPPAPYTYSGDEGSAPYIPGGSMTIVATGASVAGFGAFQVPFVATNILQSSPALSSLTLGAVFGTADLTVGWQPGSDILDLTGTVLRGSTMRAFDCPAVDVVGSAVVPRQVLELAGGEPSTVSITLTRTRSTIAKGLATVGTLTNHTVEPEGWVEVLTTSTETHTFQGCSSYQRLCGDACIDVTFDNANCGACGKVCGAGTECWDGQCVLDCQYPMQDCGGSACVNTNTSNQYCGDCYTSCGAGTSCQAGWCEPTGTGGSGGSGGSGGTGGSGGSGWTCSPDWYDGDDGCDCGCGILDPDCVSSSWGACDYCACGDCITNPNYICQ